MLHYVCSDEKTFLQIWAIESRYVTVRQCRDTRMQSVNINLYSALILQLLRSSSNGYADVKKLTWSTISYVEKKNSEYMISSKDF